MDEAGNTSKPICLVLAPFGGTWGAVHSLLQNVLESDGVAVRWLNSGTELDKPIALAVHQYVEQADVVIADITGLNPNVMYELGFARALRKPVLPVVERNVEAVPPVVRGRLFLVYDRTDPAEAVSFLREWVGRHVVREAEVEELVG